VNLLEAVFLGAVEGLTEFLPVSSTGHLTITEKLLNMPIDSPAITAFTAIIQAGAVLATIVYFWADIWRVGSAWTRGVFRPELRADPDYKFGWYIIAGSIPIGIVGLVFKDLIEGALRSLWFVGAALIVWSAVMWFAERAATQQRQEKDVTLADTLIIGTVQCLALIPGVSRSGATISAGLLRDLDRTTATRMSFLLAIPALLGAGAMQLVEQADEIAIGVGWAATGVATVVSFAVAYASIAWLLRFVARHPISVFIWYRIALGGAILAALWFGVLPAT
jgi:undecaprenyl-diphosphatase